MKFHSSIFYTIDPRSLHHRRIFFSRTANYQIAAIIFSFLSVTVNDSRLRQDRRPISCVKKPACPLTTQERRPYARIRLGVEIGRAPLVTVIKRPVNENPIVFGHAQCLLFLLSICQSTVSLPDSMYESERVICNLQLRKSTPFQTNVIKSNPLRYNFLKLTSRIVYEEEKHEMTIGAHCIILENKVTCTSMTLEGYFNSSFIAILKIQHVLQYSEYESLQEKFNNLLHKQFSDDERDTYMRQRLIEGT